jgi:phosphotransferase system HPr (HPr) family protein
MVWMIHFYERHEDEIRQGEAKSVISGLVNKVDILSHIVNFAFYYSHEHVKKGNDLSREILKTFVKNVRYEVPVPDPLGFHARPSTYVSLIVRKYGAEAWLVVDQERFDAKSVMSLLQAGGVVADKGYKTVVFEGDQRALDDIKILAAHNYCEEDGIPSELEYLRGAGG